MANKGIVNSAITMIMETARNLLYPGIKSKKKSVSGIKCFPHAKRIDKTVVISKNHFILPFTKNKPNINKKTTIAPA